MLNLVVTDSKKSGHIIHKNLKNKDFCSSKLGVHEIHENWW